MFQMPSIPPQVQAGYQQARGRVAQLWGQRPQLLKDNPLLLPTAALGAVGVNSVMDNPLGGVIDAVTMGATNFKPDDDSAYLPPSSPPTQAGAFSPHGETQSPTFSLNAEERKRQADYLKRKIATDMLTLQTLEIQQAGDPSVR